MVGHTLNDYFLGFLLEAEITQSLNLVDLVLCYNVEGRRENGIALFCRQTFSIKREMAMMKSLGVHALWWYGVCGIMDMDLIANSDGRYRIRAVRLRKKIAKQT